VQTGNILQMHASGVRSGSGVAEGKGTGANAGPDKGGRWQISNTRWNRAHLLSPVNRLERGGESHDSVGACLGANRNIWEWAGTIASIESSAHPSSR
jgi:hypothetical protein